MIDYRRPRVLTVQELKALPRGAIVFVEFYSYEIGRAEDPVMGLKCGDGTIVDENMNLYDDFAKDVNPMQPDGFWRFWNMMPDELAKRSTPWRRK